MQIHVQSPIAFIYIEKKDMLKQVDREHHTAVDVACPRCGIARGQPCREGTKWLPSLSVHLERQNASL